VNGSNTYHAGLVLAMILKRTAAQMQTQHGFVGIIDIVHNGVLVEFGIGMGEYYIGDLISPYGGMTKRVLQTKTCQLITNYQTWSGRFQDIWYPRQDEIGSVAAAPVILHNSIVAILVFILEKSDLQNEAEIFEQLRQVSDHASAVLSDLDKVAPYPPLLIMPAEDTEADPSSDL
jgi:hypothetical protein